MWPMRLDMSRDECQKCLRCLELEAYGTMVSVLRAQGALTGDKQKLLQDLAKILRISAERHRAEVRRAVNDEELSTIAEQLSGPNTGMDWAVEGRRTVPLLPRLAARSVFTGLAGSLSLVTCAANEKEFTVPTDTREDVKIEMSSHVESQAVEEESSRENISIQLEEETLNCRKRRNSLLEPDETGVIQLNEDNEIACGARTQISHNKPKSLSPMPAPSCRKVILVSSTSALDVPRNMAKERVSKICTTSSPHSTTTITCQSLPATTSAISPVRSDTTDSCKSITCRSMSSTVIPSYVTVPGKSRSKVMTLQAKAHSKTASSMTLTASLQHSAVKMMLPEIHNTPTAKEMRSGAQGTTVIGGSTVSSGPGPPQMKPPTTAVSACKKITASKPGHQPATTMSTSLNSSKTSNVTSNSGTRMAAKANVILVQKGSSRGITLSHAGKEVLGKVIVGGRNICLSNQQAAGSIALLPQRVAGMGEQALAMMSPMSGSQTESSKTNTKSGNMILFDLRQEDLGKNKVLSQFLEASGVFSSESKDHNPVLLVKQQGEEALHSTCSNSRTFNPKDIAPVTFPTAQKDHRSEIPSICQNNSDRKHSTAATDCSTVKEIPRVSESSKEGHGLLDPQTGVYSFHPTDDSLDSVQLEESMPDTGIDIFSTALASADINLESFRYIDDDEDNDALEEATSPILAIERLNDLYDCQESINDQ